MREKWCANCQDELEQTPHPPTPHPHPTHTPANIGGNRVWYDAVDMIMGVCKHFQMHFYEWESFHFHLQLYSNSFLDVYMDENVSIFAFSFTQVYSSLLNTLRPEQNEHHFLGNFSTWIFLIENFCIFVQISTNVCSLGSNCQQVSISLR